MYNELYNIGQQIDTAVKEQMTEVKADDVGLDRRAAHRLWVTEDTIAVSKDVDRGLQYYGGFEYVDKEYRMEMGDWVFYFADDERVADHLSQYHDKETA
jgi:hypothetical protein|tara:strand:+ start:243 stop:539 length:297 start_codon:yes stop_codon:yes gene_type:complete